MDKNFVRGYIMTNADKLENKDIDKVARHLESLPDDRSYAIYAMTLKSPLIAVLLGVLFGVLGVDMFYAGRIKRGAGKLALSVLSFFMFITLTIILTAKYDRTANAWEPPYQLVSLILMYALFAIQIIIFVWWIIDIIKIMSIVKAENAATILKL